MGHSAASLANLDLATLAERLGRRCREQGVTLTTAESCTGGGVASAITAVAGSSDYFETGYVTYSNAAKARLLGVPTALIEAHGAVSSEVVEAMVAGACRDSGASLGVAISGVAGPGGGSDDKPVGTVWLAFGDEHRQSSVCHHFPGDRRAVRERAVREALVGLIRVVEAEAPVG
ncbi:CinA family protein [Halomonas urumqiensis]|uniref:Damage-inducible protein CinA n=1 Tax=Halomonas urumqiensis TaxID=1684789 RepID=A0A2N7UII8_9GAMM|nr:CinA family protein [Halomonas urumqiensis]PMR80276.1 damage-inducible protein CinA [Halomonas urumqiensis]PTB01621.1 CinA family protein [Halomonas urumqiensis]GHE22285.1 damage-inducible protein CinA [Halomonas urumqiensis]